jgi:hypothetical protein
MGKAACRLAGRKDLLKLPMLGTSVNVVSFLTAQLPKLAPAWLLLCYCHRAVLCKAT